VRVVYVGTSEFAAAVLEQLHSSGYSPVLVVSRPDRRKGRGRKVQQPPVVAVAEELGLPFTQPESINGEEFLALLSELNPDAICVCAYGALLKEPLLSSYELINVHPSLLPRWRGAAPIERAVMAGDTETGVSIMRMVAGLDAGPVCVQERTPIGPNDTYGELAKRLQTISGELLVKMLSGSREYLEQDEQNVTYAEKISKEDRVLNPAKTAYELSCQCRALTPHIGAKLKLISGEALGVGQVGRCVKGVSGSVGDLVSSEGSLMLICGDLEGLELLTVQPPGKQQMSAEAYLNGYELLKAVS